jgi:pimeloyl-ACP methyl ester carboxylesterase
MISAEYTLPGMHIKDHNVKVPLDWLDDSSGASIELFARELVRPARRNELLPVLLFLQGGPGGKGPRPADASGWIGQALETHRVLLLDQRGTGRSSRVDGRVMSRFENGQEGADYLLNFRADSIVADAEYLRKNVFGGARWSTLGQSYGGFLTLTYLSQAPEGLSACYVTGGLPSVSPDPVEVYRRTYPRTEAKNRIFYRRYPHAHDLTGKIADRLAAGDVRLPDGDLLTVRRFQSLGIDLGMQPGFERLHWLLDEALCADGELTDTFLAQVQARSSYADNPLFAALQESIYGHRSNGPFNWAAQQEHNERPEFAEGSRPLLFTGEMIFPWMFADIRALRPFQAAVEDLASRTAWSGLYDPDVLAANEVPVAAAVYYDDMFVDSGLQLETAGTVGNLHVWVTNEFEHDGLGNERVFARLKDTINDLGGGILG